jgi:hypothetical protein
MGSHGSPESVVPTGDVGMSSGGFLKIALGRRCFCHSAIWTGEQRFWPMGLTEVEIEVEEKVKNGVIEGDECSGLEL